MRECLGDLAALPGDRDRAVTPGWVPLPWAWGGMDHGGPQIPVTALLVLPTPVPVTSGCASCCPGEPSGRWGAEPGCGVIRHRDRDDGLHPVELWDHRGGEEWEHHEGEGCRVGPCQPHGFSVTFSELGDTPSPNSIPSHSSSRTASSSMGTSSTCGCGTPFSLLVECYCSREIGSPSPEPQIPLRIRGSESPVSCKPHDGISP